MENNIKEFIYKYKIITIAVIFLLVSIGINILLVLKKDKKTIEIIEQPIMEVTTNDAKPQEENIPKKIKIDIKGEIKKPGVYELNEGDRVVEAIKISGGLTDKADTTLINLSKNLKDEMVIIVYNKDMINELKQGEVKTETIIQYIEKECVCPDNINDACINKNEENIDNKTEEKTENKKISINTATIEELTTLTGIGESKAKLIIEYRNTNGKFNSIEELMNIKGIGETTFEKFKHQITI